MCFWIYYRFLNRWHIHFRCFWKFPVRSSSFKRVENSKHIKYNIFPNMVSALSGLLSCVKRITLYNNITRDLKIDRISCTDTFPIRNGMTNLYKWAARGVVYKVAGTAWKTYHYIIIIIWLGFFWRSWIIKSDCCHHQVFLKRAISILLFTVVTWRRGI